MVNVIGVRFENAGKLYFFTPGALWPTPGDFVIVETTRGIEFGEVVTEVREIDDTKLTTPLKQVVRIATEEDILHDKENKAAEKEAFTICQKKIADHKLDMKLVSVEYTFDNKTILFYFTANGRVDFRSLVKDLADSVPAAARFAAARSLATSSPCPSRWRRNRICRSTPSKSAASAVVSCAA